MTNWDIANILLQTKLLLLLRGEKELAAKYENAAYTIGILDYPANDKGIAFLPEIIQSDIQEILNTGNCEAKETLEKEIPKSLRGIANLPGMRAENAIKLYEKLQIDSINDLKRAVSSGEIKEKKEFGIRFEEQLRRSLIEYERDFKELTLFEGYTYAKSIMMFLNKDFTIKLAGSVRRGKELVNNIDFVVAGDKEKFKKILNELISIKKTGKENQNFVSIKDKYNIILNFYFVPHEYFYSALIYFTGSKIYSKMLNEIGKVKGFNISKEGYLLIEGQDEKQIFEKLGMQYTPPEIREGEEEIDLALSNSLPELIDEKDIKGDLHIHSNFSDGTNSIREIKNEASFKNYTFIAITDHSQSLKIARGVSKEKLLKEFEIIDKINMDGDEPVLLKGIEAEINMDGTLDLEMDLEKKFDIIIGALHAFSQTNYENTERVKKAIESGLINVIAHPTGRIIHVREAMPLNFDEISKAASKNRVTLEINLFPNRIDLSSGLVKEARRNGLKYFSIGTDAHNTGHLNFMEYGIKILRRSWVKREELINTFELKELREFLWNRKH
ncbi:MAG: PHP domain-containing protein [Caldiserica bacterium]|nr:PHP domain-containing protein [Caldisericota bacterium]